MLMNKDKNGIQLKQWSGATCTQYALKNVQGNNSRVCPYPCPKVWACILYTWTKGKHFKNPLLVVKAFMKGTLKVLIFFVKGQSLWHVMKEIELWDAPTLG